MHLICGIPHSDKISYLNKSTMNYATSLAGLTLTFLSLEIKSVASNAGNKMYLKTCCRRIYACGCVGGGGER